MNRKNHSRHHGKARAAFQQEKIACTFTGSLSQPQESGWEEAQKLWRHKNIKRHNTKAKKGWKGFLDFAIKVKLRTKTSMKSFINKKRIGVLWNHMNIIHNPTPATDAFINEKRIRCSGITWTQFTIQHQPLMHKSCLNPGSKLFFFFKYSLQHDTTQKARPQAQATSLSLKFRYTRK